MNVVEGAEVDVVELADVDEVDDEACAAVVVVVVVAAVVVVRGRVVDIEVEVELDEVLAGGSVDVEVVLTTDSGSEVEVVLLDDEVVGGTVVGSVVVVEATDVGGTEVVSAAVVGVAVAMEVKLELLTAV